MMTKQIIAIHQIIKGDIMGLGLDEIWVAECSKIQGCNHICTLAQSISINLGIALRGESCDYSIIFIGTSSEECSAFLRRFESKMDELLEAYDKF
jgi:hypothetical protein